MSQNETWTRADRNTTRFLALVGVVLAIAAGVVQVKMNTAETLLGPSPTENPGYYGLKQPHMKTIEEIAQGGYYQADDAEEARRAGVNDFYQGELDKIETLRNWRNGFLIAAVVISVLPILAVLYVRYVLTPFARDVFVPGLKKTAVEAGKLTARTVKAVDRFAPAPNPIAKGNLSTADELRKWSDLKTEGVITEEEYLKMRAAILGKK